MDESGQIRPFPRGASAWLRLACLLGAGLLAGAGARAACIDMPFADLQSLAELDLTNASQAVAHANAAIAATKHDHKISPLRVAALYAVAAQSNSILELDDPARAAALAGLGLNPPEDSAIRLSLMSSYAETVYDVAGLKREVAKLTAAAERQPRGSQNSVCLLNTIG